MELKDIKINPKIKKFTITFSWNSEPFFHRFSKRKIKDAIIKQLDKAKEKLID